MLINLSVDERALNLGLPQAACGCAGGIRAAGEQLAVSWYFVSVCSEADQPQAA